METFTVTTLEELAAVAAHVKEHLAMLPANCATTLTLIGDLGAGKTAFVQCLGSHLGITEPIVSPTFVVMKSYITPDERFQKLVHIDAYRIESDAEVVPLRLTPLLEEPNTLCCIEWPTKITPVLPSVRTELRITESAGVRTLTMTPYGY